MTALAPNTLHQVILLLVSGLSEAAVLTGCIQTLGLSAAAAREAYAEARRSVTRAARVHADEELGRAITRLHDLYARALGAKEIRIALSVQSELNSLLRLAPPPESPPDAATARASAETSAEGRRERRAAESAELAALIDAIEGYLEPLALSADPADTDADLIRLAADEIRRRRPKPRKKKKPRHAGQGQA
ncbi:MAG: hypothetical protein IMZ66_11805 [Planctomycetes bacterium]|nr:hypothetical protein [Planctomycetota bacterium]